MAHLFMSKIFELGLKNFEVQEGIMAHYLKRSNFTEIDLNLLSPSE